MENDHKKTMVLGAVWCPLAKTKDISHKLKEIKKNHNLCKNFELKWTKVSPAKVDYYINVVSYFFNEVDLHFRSLIISDKMRLCHKDFKQDHNSWYYKMFFILLNAIFNPYDSSYRIYIDVKDICSSMKVKKLHEVLCNKNYDFSHDIIERIQSVRSNEVEILQLSDLLIGAISYISRDLKTSKAKLKIIEEIKKLSGYTLQATTLLREDKFNLFFWKPKESDKA